MVKLCQGSGGSSRVGHVRQWVTYSTVSGRVMYNRSGFSLIVCLVVEFPRYLTVIKGFMKDFDAAVIAFLKRSSFFEI